MVTRAGIYISIPFCRQKCTYCNFASDVHPSVLLPSYVESLMKEITGKAALWEKAGIPASSFAADSIYMGGGTPGLLTFQQLAAILDAVRASFPLADDVEVTIEASPENVTSASAATWAALGINRVSVGVQSMDREEIRAVGRIYDPADVGQAFSSLRAAGIRNVSGDLIAGLPHQTAASWEHSLRALLELEPSHVSVYMLEVDDDSRLGHELLREGARYHAGTVPSEEQVVEFYQTAMERLRAADFEHYEISNFARSGRRSRHNEKYWINVPYFGFGADAHSYDGERRWANAHSVVDYMKAIERGGSPVVEQRTLGSSEKLEERFFLGLRRREGLSLEQLNAEFAPNAHQSGGGSVNQRWAKPIREFCETGCLETDGDCLRLTDLGVIFSNEVFAGFLDP